MSKQPESLGECYERGICTYAFTGRNYVYQIWYSIPEWNPSEGFCIVCANAHYGDRTADWIRKSGEFFCDLGARGQSKCLPAFGSKMAAVLIESLIEKWSTLYYNEIPAFSSPDCGYFISKINSGVDDATYFIESEPALALKTLKSQGGSGMILSVATPGKTYKLLDGCTFVETTINTLKGHDSMRVYAHQNGHVFRRISDLLNFELDLSFILNHSYESGSISLHEILNSFNVKSNPDLALPAMFFDYKLISNLKPSENNVCNSKDGCIKAHKIVLATVPFFKTIFTTSVGSTDQDRELKLPYNIDLIDTAISFVYGRTLVNKPDTVDLKEIINLLCMWYPERSDLVEVRAFVYTNG